MSYILDLRNALKEENRHMPIIQVGAAIIVAKGNEILLQRRADNDRWGLPGGVQELNETVQENALRELYEETNLVATEKELILFNVFSGASRYAKYPNEDEVYNNTTVYIVEKYDGELRYDYESKDMKFFSIYDLPKELFKTDQPIIDEYVKYISNKKGAGTKYIGIGAFGFIVKDNKVLLLRRKGKETFELPGGTIEFGERIKDCLVRELKEETDIEVEIENLIVEEENVAGIRHWIVLGYACKYIGGEAKRMESDTHDEVRWFDLSNLPSNISYLCRECSKVLLKK